MIKHIVCWKILKDGTEEERRVVYRTFEEKLEYLKTIIPEIVEARVGVNYNEGDVFNLCIDSVFNSKEELSAYINHPEHLKVRAYLDSVSYDKMVFDYFI